MLYPVDFAMNNSVADTDFYMKGGQQSLLLYVNPSITQPPVDRLNSNFACRAQMGSSFLR